MTFDDVFANISRTSVPGFAGYYVENDSNIVLMLVDTTQLAAATSFVSLERVRMRLPAARSVTVRHATFDFATLKSWGDALAPLVGRNGVYMLDIDEVRNRVWIGVADVLAATSVQRRASELALPPDAVQIEMVPAPTYRDSSLDSHWRPVAGGLFVSDSAASEPICSLGFTAYQGGYAYLVTAAHCSKHKYAVDGSAIFQPDYNWPQLGVEVKDPGCYLPDYCRFSDVAMFRYDPGTEFRLGAIMQTLYPVAGGPGSRLIYEAEPYFDIRWKWDAGTDAPVGTELHKMGRTTGWTGGTVTQTCVLIGNLFCQWVSTIYSDAGDSGSPIFQPSTNPWPSAALHGILWGGPVGNPNVTYHSSLYGIEMDLGTLSVCIPGACGQGGGGGGDPGFTVLISGPDPIQPYASCQYMAQTTNGTEPFTYAWTQDGLPVGDGTMYLHNTGSPSAFQLAVTVTDSNGHTADHSITVSINQGAPQCNDS